MTNPELIQGAGTVLALLLSSVTLYMQFFGARDRVSASIAALVAHLDPVDVQRPVRFRLRLIVMNAGTRGASVVGTYLRLGKAGQSGALFLGPQASAGTDPLSFQVGPGEVNVLEVDLGRIDHEHLSRLAADHGQPLGPGDQQRVIEQAVFVKTVSAAGRVGLARTGIGHVHVGSGGTLMGGTVSSGTVFALLPSSITEEPLGASPPGFI